MIPHTPSSKQDGTEGSMSMPNFMSNLLNNEDEQTRNQSIIEPGTPRSDYDDIRKHINRLTLNMIMTLDINQVNAIRNDFEKYPEESTSQAEFVEVMLRHLRLPDLYTTPKMLVWALSDLFDSMDLDGDKSLDFDEFLATIVHMGMGAADQLVIDPIKLYSEGRNRFKQSKYNVENQLRYSSEFDQVLILQPTVSFSMCDPITLKPQRVLPVTCGAILAYDIFKFKLVDKDKDKRKNAFNSEYTNQKGKDPSQFSYGSRRNAKQVGSTVKVGDTVTILIGGSSNRLYLWETHEDMVDHSRQDRKNTNAYGGKLSSPKPREAFTMETERIHTFALSDEKKCKVPEVCIKWVYGCNRLYTGNAKGVISVWEILFEHESNVLKFRERNANNTQSKRYRLNKLQTIVAHSDVITSIISIDSMDLMLTASLDSHIRVMDMLGHEKMIFEGHRSGIVALDYSNEYRIVLSASVDHAIGVWSPFAEKIVVRLQGHVAPLLDVQFIQGTPEIVSADSDGWIKIWDARNFTCVQTIMTTNTLHSFACLGVKHQRILATGRNAGILSYDQEGGPKVKLREVGEAVFYACYNNVLMTFVTAGRENVKIWNALNGQLTCVYRGLADAEITAICLDARQRKLIVGDHAGKIRVYNYLTGAYMKSLASHTGEINFLAYDGKQRTVISTCRRQEVKLHDERPIEDTNVLMDFLIPGNNTEVVATAYNPQVRNLAVSTTAYRVYLWNLETGGLEGELHTPGIVTCMCFLTKMPILMTGNDNGQIICYFSRPSPFRGIKAFIFHAIGFIDSAAYPLTYIAIDDNEHVLYTGNSNGQISAWNLSSIRLRIAEWTQKITDIKRMSTHGHYSLESVGSMVQPVKISPIWTIQAHENSITSLSVYDSPPSLLSAGRTAQVKLWSLQKGVSLGVLDSALALKDLSLMRQGLPRETTWDFNVDVSKRQAKHELLTADIIDCLSSGNGDTLNDRYEISYTPFTQLKPVTDDDESTKSDEDQYLALANRVDSITDIDMEQPVPLPRELSVAGQNLEAKRTLKLKKRLDLQHERVVKADREVEKYTQAIEADRKLLATKYGGAYRQLILSGKSSKRHTPILRLKNLSNHNSNNRKINKKGLSKSASLPAMHNTNNRNDGDIKERKVKQSASNAALAFKRDDKIMPKIAYSSNSSTNGSKQLSRSVSKSKLSANLKSLCAQPTFHFDVKVKDKMNNQQLTAAQRLETAMSKIILE